MIDVTLDLTYKGHDLSDTKNTVLLEENGWELVKIHWWGEGDSEDIVWASHEPCRKETRKEWWKVQRAADHFPRDNALFGSCCFCGVKCPESMQVLFKMYNWKFIPHWGQTVKGRL